MLIISVKKPGWCRIIFGQPCFMRGSNEIKSVRDCSIYDPDQFINQLAEYVEYVNLYSSLKAAYEFKRF